ncbi:class I SAM-dependent methyltransferase (plasmid) [Rhizobium sp. 32-5/1]|uniref:class I SAM-dependent methyltransferase n=1 Tax=Rhizobium sp. 32-5/1 TaxID=3019602 RepID=UPI00240D9B52|nr:class I SAM-dependent methyltransferase [Rhizobium sp. 32-5/1]WEZ85961.1 class I SAM-dependent methyltransferase [Rhizobium sp. 32-5/1]
MQKIDDFFTECDLGPRLNQLAGFFNETAAGQSGVPIRKPVIDTRLLPTDPLLYRLIELHARRQGNFDQHYHGSIPYRLEEECRMAHALLRYAELNSTHVSLYSLGTAEGTMARTLSELSRGKIQSLSCSPSEENYRCFMAFGEPPHAHFFLGPFHRVTKDYLRSQETLQQFSGGFDFILEDTTFQMYSPNRQRQIEFVAGHLNEDGILLFMEKFRAADPDDYAARESQKDFGFKTRYFGLAEIQRKSRVVLSTMHECEVTLAEMANAVYAHFRYCVVTWNSGNFYGLAASNSKQNLRRYLSQMVHPAIPAEYVYDPEPYTELATWMGAGEYGARRAAQKHERKSG